MSKAKVEKRCKIKPFIKIVNYNHIMPTRFFFFFLRLVIFSVILKLSFFSSSTIRYVVDFDLKKSIDESAVFSENRVETRKMLKKLFEDKYKNQTGKNEKKTGGVQYFFKKLRF